MVKTLAGLYHSENLSVDAMQLGFCTNPDVIRAIYADEFVERRYEDSGYYGWIDDPKVFYLVGVVGNKYIGCAMCIMRDALDIEAHLAIPGEHRFHSVEFCNLACDLLFNTFTNLNRISTGIVACFPQVMNITKRFGFKHEGVKRGAAKREDGYHDVHIYSILRSEHGRRW